MPAIRMLRGAGKEHNDLRERSSNGGLSADEQRRLHELNREYRAKKDRELAEKQADRDEQVARARRSAPTQIYTLGWAGIEALYDPLEVDWDDVMDSMAAEGARTATAPERQLKEAEPPAKVKKEWKPYWIKLDSGLLERRDLSDGAKLLYAWLVNQSNVQRDWKKPFAPGNDSMAQKLGTTRKRIGRQLTELEGVGLITVQRRGARNASIISVFPAES